MNMILGLIVAAIFVYIGVNLEPGLNSTVATITTPTYSSGVAGLNSVENLCAIIKRFIMQTANIGGNLKWQYRGIASSDARNDYQAVSLKNRDSGIVWTARNVDTCRLTIRILIVFAAIRKVVALKGDLHRITHQKRGKLNSEMSKPIAVLTQEMNLDNVERLDVAHPSWGGGIAHSLLKNRGSKWIIFGVNCLQRAFNPRGLSKTSLNGGNLKWQYRANLANEARPCVTTIEEVPLFGVMI